MTIQISGGNVYIPEEMSGLEWTPKDGVQIQAGNYGQILDVQMDDGKLVVQTELGKLTFSGPELEDATTTFQEHGYLGTSDRLESAGSDFNYLDCLKLLFDANKERKSVAREVRRADRDMAMAEAYNAAHEIRTGALTNMIMGCVAGAINIGMGAVSLGMSVSAARGIKMEAQEVKMSKMEMRMASTESELQNTKLELAQTKAKLTAEGKSPAEIQKNPQVKELEAREAKLTAQRDAIMDDLKTQIKTAEAERDKAAENLKLKPQDESAVKEMNDAQAKYDRLTGIKANADKVANAPDAEKVKVAETWKTEAQQRLENAFTKLNSALQNVQNKTAIAQSLTQMGQGAATISSSTGQFVETTSQADAKEHDAQAEKAKQGAEDSGQDMQSAQEVISDVIKFFQQLKEAQAQVWQKISSA
jgi:hypothetical protein